MLQKTVDIRCSVVESELIGNLEHKLLGGSNSSSVTSVSENTVGVLCAVGIDRLGAVVLVVGLYGGVWDQLMFLEVDSHRGKWTHTAGLAFTAAPYLSSNSDSRKRRRKDESESRRAREKRAEFQIVSYVFSRLESKRLKVTARRHMGGSLLDE